MVVIACISDYYESIFLPDSPDPTLRCASGHSGIEIEEIAVKTELMLRGIRL